MLNRIDSKPIRTVLRWQVYATVLIAVVAGVLAGLHGAVSAVLGGLTNQLADLACAWLASNGTSGTRQSAGKALNALIKAEAARMVLIVLLLLGVLTVYKAVVYPAFFLSFVVSVVIFRLTILVKE